MSNTNSLQAVTGDSDTLNNVEGDQGDQTLSVSVLHRHNVAVTQSTCSSRCTTDTEFQIIKRGHVYGLKEIASEECCHYNWEWEANDFVFGRHKAQKTICTVALPILPNQHGKYTIIEYEGEDAQISWEKDFQEVSYTDRKPGLVRLFGINRSEVPMLIFHDEIIPIKHLSPDGYYLPSVLMELYIGFLAKHLGLASKRWSLWMDTKRSAVCVGPETFPTFNTTFDVQEPVEVPSALEMFQDDTCARFFVNKLGNGMEQLLLRIAWDNLHQSNIEAFFTDSGAEAKRRWQPDYLKWRWQNQLCHLPDEVASLRFSTLYSRSIGAVAMWPDSGLVYSWRNVTSNLVERTAILSNGLTRFTLQSSDDPALRDSELVIENDIYMLMAQAWFLQSSRICNATVDEDTIVTIAMLLSLRGTIEGWCPALDESVPPIFLFVYPPPMTVAEYGLWDEVPPYFWSFDETGQYQMSEDEHKLWGLPVLKPKKSGIRVQSWPAHVYKSLRAWQTARGFDPTTSYWAQTLGYPELTIVEPEDQACVEVSEETNVVDSYGKKFKKGLRRLWGFK